MLEDYEKCAALTLRSRAPALPYLLCFIIPSRLRGGRDFQNATVHPGDCLRRSAAHIAISQAKVEARRCVLRDPFGWQDCSRSRGLASEAVDHAPAFRGRPLIYKITPVVGSEAQQNPSYPVISESYHGLG